LRRYWNTPAPSQGLWIFASSGSGRGATSGKEIIAGRIDLLIDNVPNSIGHIRGGQTRALAVTGSARNPALPEVPNVSAAKVPRFGTMTRPACARRWKRIWQKGRRWCAPLG
jgi:hypothetical protein